MCLAGDFQAQNGVCMPSNNLFITVEVKGGKRSNGITCGIMTGG